MCERVYLNPVHLASPAFDSVIERLRESHSNGGAFLKCVNIPPNPTFDWFASRNRLLEFDILSSLLRRSEMVKLLPEVIAPKSSQVEMAEIASKENTCFLGDTDGFKFESIFLFDAHLAQSLYGGGAYWQPAGDGKAEKDLALSLCEAAFERRFADMTYFSNFNPWTSWFHGIAWDWTAVLFDRKLRNLWVLAVTDTD